MTESGELVAGEPDPDGFVPIAFVYSLSEAAVLECTLRAYGILAFQPDYWTSTIDPPLMVALGGLRIAVPESRREDAIALLYEIDQGWTAPPRPFVPEAWLSIPLTILFGFVCGFVPPPRARGSYAWRRRLG